MAKNKQNNHADATTAATGTKPTNATPVTEEAALAFAATKPEIDAFPVSNLVTINIDLPKACSSALGVISNLEPYEAQLAAIKGLDFDRVKNLRRYVLTALYADIVATNDDALKTLVEEATELKASLLVAGDALAARGLLSATRIADIRQGNGYVDLGTDCVALSALFQESWDAISSKTAVPREEVERCGVVGTELLLAVGARNASVDHSSSMDTRQRAFSLMMRAYDEARRGITYVRWWEDDVDSILPTLYQRKRSRRTDVATDASNDTKSTTPATPATSTASNSPVAASVVPAASAPAVAPSAATPVAPQNTPPIAVPAPSTASEAKPA